MKIVLHHPEIPQNTGNVGRLCVATNTELYLVRPLGFRIEDKEIRRSGLDYWKDLKFKVVDSLEEVQKENPDSTFWFLSTKGTIKYTDVTFGKDDVLVFGSESKGLPDEIREKNKETLITIPMWGPVRSLNLSTAVGIVAYEVHRQLGFDESSLPVNKSVS